MLVVLIHIHKFYNNFANKFIRPIYDVYNKNLQSQISNQMSLGNACTTSRLIGMHTIIATHKSLSSQDNKQTLFRCVLSADKIFLGGV